MVLGIIAAILGFVFHLQGRSVVGPVSSFMYSSPEWVDYGLGIMIAGIIILSAGFAVFRKN